MNKPACFTAKIDPTLKDKLKADLESQGFTISNKPYAIFSAQKKGIVCVLYESGSLVVQGKDKDSFIEFYLEPEILSNYSYTNREAYINFKSRIGVDEAGKGDYFGPLCVAGVFADEAQIRELLSIGVRDSKKIGDKSILEMAARIKTKALYSIITLVPPKYNELYAKFGNLNHLLAWCHASVIENLAKKTGCKEAIIDQFAAESLVLSAIRRKNLSINLEQRHRGEEDPVVAAASILARAAFVEGIQKLSLEAGRELPKGASAQVKKAAALLLREKGPEELAKYVKTHFKTHGEVISANYS